MTTSPSLGILPHVYYDPNGNKGNGEWVGCWEESPCVIRNVRRPTEQEARDAIGTKPVPTDVKAVLERIAAQMAKSARGAVDG